jgi:hypothetical protein
MPGLDEPTPDTGFNPLPAFDYGFPDMLGLKNPKRRGIHMSPAMNCRAKHIYMNQFGCLARHFNAGIG